MDLAQICVFTVGSIVGICDIYVVYSDIYLQPLDSRYSSV